MTILYYNSSSKNTEQRWRLKDSEIFYRDLPKRSDDDGWYRAKFKEIQENGYGSLFEFVIHDPFTYLFCF